jgi:hypothetical protein
MNESVECSAATALRMHALSEAIRANSLDASPSDLRRIMGLAREFLAFLEEREVAGGAL